MTFVTEKPSAPARSEKFGPAQGDDFSHDPSLRAMHREAEACERCDLYKHATHLVFGEGPRDARVVLVGEQPGDQEDLAARPFVGPSGHMLDKCLHEAGIDRSALYVTNAVKHFKFEPRGKKRLHSKPNAGEIQRCAWWLGGELDLIKPKLVVALGATALYSLLGNRAKVTRSRGQIMDAPKGYGVLVTVHPSSLFRSPDRAAAEQSRIRFIEDLGKIRSYLDNHKEGVGYFSQFPAISNIPTGIVADRDVFNSSRFRTDRQARHPDG